LPPPSFAAAATLLSSSVPVIFGVLTTDTEAQALEGAALFAELGVGYTY